MAAWRASGCWGEARQLAARQVGGGGDALAALTLRQCQVLGALVACHKAELSHEGPVVLFLFALIWAETGAGQMSEKKKT